MTESRFEHRLLKLLVLDSTNKFHEQNNLSLTMMKYPIPFIKV